jgi:ketopantoate hydroxymethyltransferase
MKTLLKAALMLPLLIIAVHLHAQKVINEGKITYSTSYDIPASQWKNDGSLPTEIVIYFRGDSTAAVVKQGIATIKGVSVLKTNYHSMIIDVPDFNKKLLN